MRDFGKRNDRQGSRGSDRVSSGRHGGNRDSRRSGGYGSDRDGGYNGNSGRNSGFDRRRDSGFSRGRRDEITMHKVTCDGCGKECEVPFKPTESKPVYCSDCFKERGKNNFSGQSQHNYKEDLTKINEKIDLILEIVKGIKTSQDNIKVEPTSVKEEKKPKEKKAAVKKKIAKQKKSKK